MERVKSPVWRLIRPTLQHLISAQRPSVCSLLFLSLSIARSRSLAPFHARIQTSPLTLTHYPLSLLLFLLHLSFFISIYIILSSPLNQHLFHSSLSLSTFSLGVLHVFLLCWHLTHGVTTWQQAAASALCTILPPLIPPSYPLSLPSTNLFHGNHHQPSLMTMELFTHSRPLMDPVPLLSDSPREEQA